MFHVVERQRNGDYAVVDRIHPPPGQQNLVCDDCYKPFDHDQAIYRVRVPDSTLLYGRVKYTCRSCEGSESRAV